AVELTRPNWTHIPPNGCHSGHDEPCVDGTRGGLAAADRWLQAAVPGILSSAAFRHDGMLVITFDEAEDDAGGCCTPRPPNVERAGRTGRGGGRVGALVLAPFATRGLVSTVRYNHYSLLCTIEEAFGLTPLGYAGTPGLPCFGPDVLRRSSEK